MVTRVSKDAGFHKNPASNLFYLCFSILPAIQGLPQFAQGPLFDPGYITSADAASLRHFPLPLRILPTQTVPHGDHQPLLLGQGPLNRLLQKRHCAIGFVIAAIAFIGLPMLNILRLLLNQDDDK